MRLRLAFMGTPDFAVPTLEALCAAGHDVACVYTRPPRPAGRGQRAQISPVHRFAAEQGIPVRTPRSLKSPEEQAAFAALGLDAAVVAAYGLILPPPILAAPRLGCLNVHASLLPRWRGAAPIQHAILAGDTETGVTIMQMDAGLDTGPILLRETVPIGPETDAGALHDRLAELGAALMPRALAGLACGTLAPSPQPETGAAYAPKIDPAQARIDWRRPAAELDRLVRAMHPSPGAWFEAGGSRIKLLKAHPVAAAREAPPGTVLDEAPTVACGAGALRLERLQRAGRAPMAADAFLRGFPLPPGTHLP